MTGNGGAVGGGGVSGGGEGGGGSEGGDGDIGGTGGAYKYGIKYLRSKSFSEQISVTLFGKKAFICCVIKYISVVLRLKMGVMVWPVNVSFIDEVQHGKRMPVFA